MSDRHQIDILDLTRKALALTAVLLPVMGAAVRLIAFASDSSIPSPLKWAVAVPVAELIAAGIWPAMLGLSPLWLFLIFRRHAPAFHTSHVALEAFSGLEAIAKVQAELVLDVESRWVSLSSKLEEGNPTDKPSPEIQKEFDELQALTESALSELKKLGPSANNAVAETRSALEKAEQEWQSLALKQSFLSRWFQRASSTSRWILALVLPLLSIVFIPGQALILLPLLGVLGLTAWFLRIVRETGELTFRRAWGALFIALCLGVVTIGLSGVVLGVSAAHYTFRSGSLPDGWYSKLGSEGNLVLLRGCANRALIAVQEADIQSTSFSPRGRGWGPSLWSEVRELRLPNFEPSYSCPPIDPAD